MIKQRAAITGIQGYVPDYILTNKELENYVDTNDEWIISRTAIKERRILKGEGKGSSDLGAAAVKGLLTKTNYKIGLDYSVIPNRLNININYNVVSSPALYNTGTNGFEINFKYNIDY